MNKLTQKEIEYWRIRGNYWYIPNKNGKYHRTKNPLIKKNIRILYDTRTS